MSKKQSLTMRSLHYYWLATRNHLGLFVALVASTIGFCGFLTYGNPYVMSLVVDRVSEGSVAPEARCSRCSVPTSWRSSASTWLARRPASCRTTPCTGCRSQPPTIWPPWPFDRAVQPVDVVPFQPLRRHAGEPDLEVHEPPTQLLLETITFPFLPVHLLGQRFTCAHPGAAWCRPTRRCSWRMLAVYAVVSATYMYKRILHLNEQAASAQNQLSGELSDAVANILAVKTYGREDYERRLFDTGEPRGGGARSASACGPRSPAASRRRAITVVIMCVVAVFICRRQRLVRHHAGHGHPHVHLHEHGDEPVQLHQHRPAAHQPAPSATRAA